MFQNKQQGKVRTILGKILGYRDVMCRSDPAIASLSFSLKKPASVFTLISRKLLLRCPVGKMSGLIVRKALV